MSFLLKKLALFAALLVMAGCGMHGYTRSSDIASYPYRYADFDYKYAWKTTVADNGFLIDGVMKNVRYANIDSVQLTVNVVDKDGKTVAKATDFPMPQQTREGEECSFSLLLKDIKPAPGDILQFQVYYTGTEGGLDGHIDWHGSFRVDAMTGAVINTPGIHPDRW